MINDIEMLESSPTWACEPTHELSPFCANDSGMRGKWLWIDSEKHKIDLELGLFCAFTSLYIGLP